MRTRGTLTPVLCGVLVAVHPQHVVSDAAVDGGVHLVQHDEEQVETGEERVGQADVLGGAQVVVVLRE